MSHIACLDNDCNNKNRSRKISFLFIRSWPPRARYNIVVMEEKELSQEERRTIIIMFTGLMIQMTP